MTATPSVPIADGACDPPLAHQDAEIIESLKLRLSAMKTERDQALSDSAMFERTAQRYKKQRDALAAEIAACHVSDHAFQCALDAYNKVFSGLADCSDFSAHPKALCAAIEAALSIQNKETRK
jgi:hypothetical protein